MDIIPVTEEQVMIFLSVTAVPAIVDIIRVGVFQLAMRLKLQWLADITTHSKFGLITTMVVCGLIGLAIAFWTGVAEPTIQSVSQNGLMILGISQLLYKGAYEKSDIRKMITSVTDKIGPKSDDVDSDSDQVAVG